MATPERARWEAAGFDEAEGALRLAERLPASGSLTPASGPTRSVTGGGDLASAERPPFAMAANPPAFTARFESPFSATIEALFTTRAPDAMPIGERFAGVAAASWEAAAAAAPSRFAPDDAVGFEAASPMQAAMMAAPAPNKIVLENQKAGTPQSVWDLTNGPSSSIEGFATDISFDLGETVSFKIDTDSRNYRIDIYRLGYYGGDGARRVATLQHQAGQAIDQPDPLRDAATGLVDAGNWSVTDTWAMPADLVSGVYIAKLVRQDGTAGENHIPFIVRDDASTSDIIFQTADTTWQAYNGWGGANLYGGDGPGGGSAPGRAYAVSYNRPITTREGGGTFAGPQDFIFGVEHSAIRWMEQNGYDVSYMAGVDADRYGALLLNHKVYTSVGHDEYWSGQQRANVEAARDAGVNLAFLGGNDVYWKTRWETSIDGSGTEHRTLVSYKETREGGDIDPSDEWTGTWRDPSQNPAAGGGNPENALTGTMFQVDSYRSDAIVIPYAQSQLRFWRNTDVADTAPGESTTLVDNILGYEWNIAPDNGFTPDGLIRLSTTTLDVNTLLIDYGTTVGPGTATHSLTLYRAESGALVFSSGTVYWSWGLDENHDLEATPTDPNIQQAMVNLFADMGVQPQTLQASLELAQQTTDFTAPSSAITSITGGGSVLEGQRVTVSGVVGDVGGRVGVVEVSTDGGETWRLADSTPTSWTYSFVAGLAGNYTVLTRAVDDSLNLETPGAGTSLTVGPATRVTLFQPDEIPAPFPGTALGNPGGPCCNVCVVHIFGPTELGVKFRSERSGTISSIRFYKNEGNTGPHVGSLWTVDGQLLARATFTSETATGWQQVNFATAVTIAAGTTYVASYHTTTGVYLTSEVTQFFQPRQSGPLTALASGWEHGPNGLIAYGPAGTFPTGTPTSATNYWVDVVFNPASETGNTAPVANADTGFGAAPGQTLTLAAAALLANDTDANGDPLTITGVGNATHGTVSWNHVTHAVTFVAEAGYSGPASFTYTVVDGRGGTATASVTVTVDPALTTYSLFDADDRPAIAATNDASAIEVGVKFTSSAAGTITGIRFYKGVSNTGPHVGNLWTLGGTLLASATFVAETASGWQQVVFASPVTIAAGTTYVASYHTSTGYYASTPNYFATAHTNGGLTAPADAGIGNGVFRYGGSGFPTTSFGATNYWVDVLFRPRDAGPNQPPIANDDSGFSTPQGTPVQIAVAALVGNDTDGNGDSLSITAVGGAVGGTVSLDTINQLVLFTPTAGYQGPASFTYTVSDGRGGSDSASVSLTVTPPSETLNLFAAGELPSMLTADDRAPIELGVRFVAAVAGSITGIRFYKGPQNTGTHTATLWTAAGGVLATATFLNETATGWQQVNFAAPVSIVAGVTYVASYHTNVGNYSATPGYFSTPHANGPLSTPAAGGNGVYIYGAGGVLPTNSFNSTNYWVDVAFAPAAPEPNQPPVAVDDGGFRVARNLPLRIAAATLLANDTDANGDTLTIAGVGGAVGGTVSYDSATGTITFVADPGGPEAARFTYTVDDGAGGTDIAEVTIAVTPPAITLFSPDDVPAVVSVNDPSAIELGMRFTTSVNGTVSGIRFYKGVTNTGPHTGSLWSASGTLLASANFTAETASGWQQVDFATPVTIVAGGSYVASYHTVSGFYSATSNGFAAAQVSGPLTAPAGANGTYAYGGGGFPGNTFGSTNYWVDVVFNPAGAAGNAAPVANADDGPLVLDGHPLRIAGAALLANDVDPDGDPLRIIGVGDATQGAVSLDVATQRITFTSAAGFAGEAGFSYTIEDGRGGTATAAVTFTVTAGQTLFAADAEPAIASVNDPSAVNLGVKFTAETAGSILGLRFYKGAANTGPHVGTLWSATGTALASATFTNETASGWQQVLFAAAVEISAGTTYVASYHTASGNYSATGGFFGSDHTSGPLTAPASGPSGGNGVYAYGSDSLFPTSSFNATNYWVDVIFQGQLAA